MAKPFHGNTILVSRTLTEFLKIRFARHKLYFVIFQRSFVYYVSKRGNTSWKLKEINFQNLSKYENLITQWNAIKKKKNGIIHKSDAQEISWQDEYWQI